MRAVSWIIINSFILVCLIGGAFYDITWCRNLFLFWVGFMVFCSIVGLFNTETHKKLYDRGRVVPKLASCVIDSAKVIITAAAGWFWVAGFVLFIVFANHYMLDNPPKK